jgi:hypothetical protein
MHRPAESCMHDSEGGAHARLPRWRMRHLHNKKDLLDEA